MKQIKIDPLALSLIMSDMSHSIGTLAGIQKMLVCLKSEDIDHQKLAKIIGESQRRLTSAQGSLIAHYIKENQND